MKTHALAILLALVLASCSIRQSDNPQTGLSVRDDLGNVVAFQSPPTRVVSLAPAVTEILFAIDSGNTLVGVTDFCNYPPGAKIKTSVGGMVSPNRERITQLHPDLIVATVEGNTKQDVAALASMGYKIFVTNPRTIEGVYKSIGDLGRIIGKEPAAKSLVGNLRKREEAIGRRPRAVRRPRVLVLVSLQPLIAAGRGTFIDQLILQSGGENIVADSVPSYPILSREEVVRRKPEVISAMSDAAASPEDFIELYPEWKNLPAIRNGRAFVVEADIFMRPGPRIIEALEQLDRLLWKE
jgi:iron complex transport system substrate-binding protein